MNDVIHYDTWEPARFGKGVVEDDVIHQYHIPGLRSLRASMGAKYVRGQIDNEEGKEETIQQNTNGR
jgi:hypothetical protein